MRGELNSSPAASATDEADAVLLAAAEAAALATAVALADASALELADASAVAAAWAACSTGESWLGVWAAERHTHTAQGPQALCTHRYNCRSGCRGAG